MNTSRINRIKRLVLITINILPSLGGVGGGLFAQTSPDGKLSVNVKCDGGIPTYSITYNGTECLKPAVLGLNTNEGDFTKDLTLSKTSEVKNVENDYTLYNIKRKDNHYQANTQLYTFAKNGVDVMAVEFYVSNNNVAFQYQVLPVKKDTKCAVVYSEATTFSMPDGTTTFLCPQMGPMTGFARTAPSYETHYTADAEMGKNANGNGFTFPCLFKEAGVFGDTGKSGKAGIPEANRNIWLLISETGEPGNYPGCKLINKSAGDYQISFPNEKENNGYGSNGAQIALPGKTPWRTITIGESLKPIVESTITWDVLAADADRNPEYAQKKQILDEYRKQIAFGSSSTLPMGESGERGSYGRGAWSWIIQDDASCNFDTQKQYIDFAAQMGWQSLLIDAQWDRQIGRERIAELAKYGKEKGVALYLWYNSNGIWNDAPQTPRNCLSVPFNREQEMEWLESIGIRGIKVDFFGGDKQCTMELYRDILLDAMKHHILVIFHGCTLPRGWEFFTPNYVASEAVRASENLRFSQQECDDEAMNACFLPFLRNAVGSMDFGGSTLNKRYSKDNNHGTQRRTSDVFALATAVLFQSPVQHFAMAPNNLTDAPEWAVDFMKTVPTTWEDIRFIDGYPGKYVILARKSQEGKWYLTAINGQKEPLKVKIPTDMFQVGEMVTVYSDKAATDGGMPTGMKSQVKINKKRTMDITIPVNGAFLMCE